MEQTDEISLAQREWLFHDLSAAVTLDGSIYLFTIGAKMGSVLFAVLPAPGASSPDADHIKPEKTQPSKPVDHQDSSFPETVTVGQQVRFALKEKPTAGTYTLLSGPLGITLTNTGMLIWTATVNDVGSQHIKIRCDVDGSTSFLRYACQVVEK